MPRHLNPFELCDRSGDEITLNPFCRMLFIAMFAIAADAKPSIHPVQRGLELSD